MADATRWLRLLLSVLTRCSLVRCLLWSPGTEAFQRALSAMGCCPEVVDGPVEDEEAVAFRGAQFVEKVVGLPQRICLLIWGFYRPTRPRSCLMHSAARAFEIFSHARRQVMSAERGGLSTAMSLSLPFLRDCSVVRAVRVVGMERGSVDTMIHDQGFRIHCVERIHDAFSQGSELNNPNTKSQLLMAYELTINGVVTTFRGH